MTRALVVYGIRGGGAEELARTMGAALIGRGVAVDVHPSRQVIGFDGYDAVIVAGAVRAGRWSGDVRRLVRRRRDVLDGMPVWLVAAEAGINPRQAAIRTPSAQLADLAALVRARAALSLALTPAPASASAQVLDPGPAQTPDSGCS
ncbi:flavodoxin domain-containing protein, partial [Frankia sp. AiPs1]